MPFTKTLGDANSPARVIDPGPQGPSVLGTLAEAAGQVVGGLQAFGNAQAHSATRRLDAASDSIATARWGDQVAEAAAVAPQAAVDAVERLRGMQGAREQGNLSESGYGLQLETTVNRLIRDNPDQSAEIMDYLRVQGFDSFIFRDATNARDQADAQRAQVQATQQAGYDYALTNIPNVDTTKYTFEQIATMGIQRQAVEAQADVLRQRAESEASLRRTNQEINAFDERQTQEGLYTNSTQNLASELTPGLEGLFTGFREAGNNLDAVNAVSTQIPEMSARINAAVLREVARAQRNGASASTIASIRAAGEDYVNALHTFADDPSYAGIQGDILSRLENSYGLSAAETMPVLSRLSSLVGEAGTAALIQTTAAGEALQGGIQGEVSAFIRGSSTPGAQRGAQHLTVFGQNGIDTIDDNLRETFTPAYRERLRIAGANVADGDEASLEPYVDDAHSWLNLADSLVYGQVSANQFQAATDILFDSEAQTNMRAALEMNPTLGAPLMDYSRQQAVRLLEVGQAIQSPSSFASGWAINFDSLSGQFVPTSPPAARGDVYVEGAPIGLAANTRQSRIPQAVHNQIDALNNTLNFLVGTHDTDPRLNQDITTRDLRQAYATGTVSRDYSQQEPAPVSSASTPALDRVLQLEGNRLEGYIPTSGSGVTIAGGLDLSQNSHQDLVNLGLPADLITRLDEGRTAEDPTDLRITAQEADVINRALLQDNRQKLAADVAGYSALPQPAQVELAALRHWSGSLTSPTNSKLQGNSGGNPLQAALEGDTIDISQIVSALEDIQANSREGTARRNRITRHLEAFRELAR